MESISDQHHRTIEISARPSQLTYWASLWEYRELILFLARRDLLIKYRQTAAGLLWLIARPTVQVLMFTFIFGQVAGLPDGGVPYAIVALSGVTVWTLFNAIVTQGSICLVNNHSLITKVHFPRLILPISTILPNLIDLFIILMGLILLFAWYQILPTWRIFLAPIPILLTALIALGISLFTSAGSVRYRDLRQLVPFALQALLFLTPIGYMTSAVSDTMAPWVNAIYHLNPLVAAVDLFRWTLFPPGYGPAQNINLLVISLGTSLILISLGQWYFRRAERTFADVI